MNSDFFELAYSVIDDLVTSDMRFVLVTLTYLSKDHGLNCSGTVTDNRLHKLTGFNEDHVRWLVAELNSMSYIWLRTGNGDRPGEGEFCMYEINGNQCVDGIMKLARAELEREHPGKVWI